MSSFIKNTFKKFRSIFKPKHYNNTTKKSNDNNTYSWLLEFSKKVVFVIFLIYIINYIVCWVASFICGLKSWNIPYIDTFITSTNETTQIVLGGYLFKAMAENIIKVRNSNSSNNNIDNIDNIDNINDDELMSDDSDNNSSF